MTRAVAEAVVRSILDDQGSFLHFRTVLAQAVFAFPIIINRSGLESFVVLSSACDQSNHCRLSEVLTLTVSRCRRGCHVSFFHTLIVIQCVHNEL